MNEMASVESTTDMDVALDVHASSGSSSSMSAGTSEHRCSATITTANRLSAPECSSNTAHICLHKSRTSSSLVDVNESQFHGSYTVLWCYVCVSVCLSQVGGLWKQLNVSSHKQCYMIVCGLSFLVPKILEKFWWDHPLQGNKYMWGR